MADKNETKQKAIELAREVLKLSSTVLFVELRFLDVAMMRLEPIVDEGGPLATDGEHLYYGAPELLRDYRAETKLPSRNYLHVLLHCVFRHFLNIAAVDRQYWDIACDIAVENVIDELKLPAFSCSRQAAQENALNRLRKAVPGLTAERLYHYFKEKQLSVAELQDLRAVFAADDHSLWYFPPQSKINGRGDRGENSASSRWRSRYASRSDQETLQREWSDISTRVEQDLKSFSKERGDRGGFLIQNLAEVNRERYDYTAFLRKFATMHEAMRINDDEFDYVYYSYGLKLYKNMPLVEPLEYKEVKQIHDFVIAIDTSGSVRGNKVQSFLQKTYNILKSEESFTRKFNLYIIQCDAVITEAVKITSQEGFDRYLQTVTLKGFGGTDFRPVFDFVDQMIKEKEFDNLKGMIYFTDGLGVFPKSKPAYETAFIFVRDTYDEIPEIPPWAIKLILSTDDIG